MNVDLDRPARGQASAKKKPVKRGKCISFSEDILARIQDRARKRGQSVSGVVNLAVTESLERWARQDSEERQ